MTTISYAPESQEYTNLRDNGHNIYERMHAAAKGQKKFMKSRRLQPNYYVEGTESANPLKLPTPTTRRLLRESGTPVDDYRVVTIKNDPNVGENSAQPIYINAIHEDGRALICPQNYKENDALNLRSGQLFWSDLIPATCERVLQQQGKIWATMANIETI